MELKCGCSFTPFKISLCPEAEALMNASNAMADSGQTILLNIVDGNGIAHLYTNVTASYVERLDSSISRFMQNAKRNGCYREGNSFIAGRQKTS